MDRQALDKRRVALQIMAERAMSINEMAKRDSIRVIKEQERLAAEKKAQETQYALKAEEERIRKEEERIAAEQREKREQIERQRKEEARLKAEAEERERKYRIECEAKAKAEAEALRIKAENEAREAVERRERLERERREREVREERMRRTRERWGNFFNFVMGILPVLPAAYWSLNNYRLGANGTAGIIGGSVLVVAIMYFCGKIQHRFLYYLFGLGMVGTAVWCCVHGDDRLPVFVSGGGSVIVFLSACSLIGGRGIGVIHVLSVITGMLSTAVLLFTKHWFVGGWMALLLLGVCGAISEKKVHWDGWRWIIFAFCLLISGGLGLDGHWIVSPLITLVAIALVIEGDDE